MEMTKISHKCERERKKRESLNSCGLKNINRERDISDESSANPAKLKYFSYVHLVHFV